MIDVLGWLGMVLVVATVWQLSAGRTASGNLLNIGATASWFTVGVATGQVPLAVLQVILFLRSAWVLWKERK